MGPLALALSAVSGIASMFSNKSKSETTNTSESGTSKSSARTLSAGTEGELTGVLSGLLSGGISNSTNALNAQTDDVRNNPIQFDRESFVKGITGKADADLLEGFQTSLNDLFSGLGANAGSNSAALLLKDKLNTKRAVESAGVRANAESTGVQIQDALKKSQTGQLTDIAAQFKGLLDPLITGVKGASVTETTDSSKKGTGTGTAKESGFDGSGGGLIGDLVKSALGIKY